MMLWFTSFESKFFSSELIAPGSLNFYDFIALAQMPGISENLDCIIETIWAFFIVEKLFGYLFSVFCIKKNTHPIPVCFVMPSQ